MPVQHVPYMPPMQYCYPMPVMPVCDPCYPYPHPHGFMNAYPQQMMMPQVQGVGVQSNMYQPAVLPGTVASGYEMESSSWGESSSHMGMHHHMSNVSPAAMPYTGVPMQMPVTQGDCGCGG